MTSPYVGQETRSREQAALDLIRKAENFENTAESYRLRLQWDPDPSSHVRDMIAHHQRMAASCRRQAKELQT